MGQNDRWPSKNDASVSLIIVTASTSYIYVDVYIMLVLAAEKNDLIM